MRVPRERLIILLTVIVCFFLQCTLFKKLEIASIAPNLLIIVTSSFGFMRGKNEGIFVGFFCGILMDIFFGDVMGLYTLIYVYIGYINGCFRQMFYDEEIRLSLILIGGSDLLYGFVVYAAFFLLRKKFNFGYYLTRIIIPEMVYTVCVAVVLYQVLRLINRRLEGIEKRSGGRIV